MRARISRLHLAIPVFVYGTRESGNPFREITQTVTINANGCLVELETEVEKGQALLLVNSKSGEEMACTVVTVGDAVDGKSQVGISFGQASPRFWGLMFPPEDWDPSERKRPERTRR